MGLAVQDERLAARVGAVVIVATMVAVALVISLGSVHLRAGFDARVYLEHPGALSEGDSVQAAGRIIGYVKSIQLVPERLTRTEGHPLRGTGGVAVLIRLEKRYAHMAPLNGAYFINSKGLLGEQYLEVGPPDDGGPRDRALRAGDEVRGIDPPRLDRVLQQSLQNLVNTSAFMEAVTPEVKHLMRELDQLADTLEAIEPRPGAYADTGAAIGRAGTEGARLRDGWREAVDLDLLTSLPRRTRETADRTRVAIAAVRARIDVLAAELTRIGDAVPADARARFEAALSEARTALDRVDAILEKARDLAAMLERGEGTLGALMNDPEFSDDAKQLGKLLKTHPWRLLGRPAPDNAVAP